jgi:hypothetical protein
VITSYLSTEHYDEVTEETLRFLHKVLKG